MCFAPQRRALFRHLNFQKWSDAEVFCTFWLGNVLRATTACNFSSLIWPAGSAPAALASLLFDPPEPQIIGKTPVFRDFPTFSRICIFFLLIFSLLTLFTSAFQLSILSEVSLLNFLRWKKTYKTWDIGDKHVWMWWWKAQGRYQRRYLVYPFRQSQRSAGQEISRLQQQNSVQQQNDELDNHLYNGIIYHFYSG